MTEIIRAVLDDPDHSMPKRRPNPLDMTPEKADAFYAALKARQEALIAKPSVAAILDRVGRLTADERTRLHEAWIKHYRMYRTHQSDIWHRAWRRYGEHWRDVLAVEEIVRRAEREGLGPYEGDVWGASHAASDAARVALLADLIDPSEAHVYTDPWNAVIGDPKI